MVSRFLEAYILLIRRLLPSPLTIALLLTLFTFLVVILFGKPDQSLESTFLHWSSGLWQPDLLVFAVQMMLILVLGHTLALSAAADRVISQLVKHCTTSEKSAAIVAICAMLVGFFNWGHGLIFGAVMARKVAEQSHKTGTPLNYGLIGAAGYSAMLIWHGGLSGSSLIKVAESGHLKSIASKPLAAVLPEALQLQETVFSSLNITTSILMLILIPLSLFGLGKFAKGEKLKLRNVSNNKIPIGSKLLGSERLDHSTIFSRTIGTAVLCYCVLIMLRPSTGISGFFTPNNINLFLLGMCLLAHHSITAFTEAAEEATKGASGILLQFPLYFGILALMQQSGLAASISESLVEISSESTFPIITFFSAGIVNLFVPSGGGQWALQGPIIIESSVALNVPLHKGIMAMAYGDQVTNMLQPFWALPLLGVTGLSARDILPYTLVMFVIGGLVFSTTLLFL